jgi:hypothetical protein
MRLTDWIINAVEAHMEQQSQRVIIPDGIDFSDLKMAREPGGSVTYDMSVIELICKASNLPIELIVDAPEDNLAGLVIRWYEEHLKHGGKPDPVAEDLIAEVKAENKAGQSHSHKPGSA